MWYVAKSFTKCASGFRWLITFSLWIIVSLVSFAMSSVSKYGSSGFFFFCFFFGKSFFQSDNIPK